MEWEQPVPPALLQDLPYLRAVAKLRDESMRLRTGILKQIVLVPWKHIDEELSKGRPDG